MLICAPVLAIRLAGVTINARAEYERNGKPTTNGDTDWSMYRDPMLPRYKIFNCFHPQLAGLLVRALQQGDTETVRVVSSEIIIAQKRNMPGLHKVVAAQVKWLGHEHAVARRSVARALVSIDAKEAVADLFKANDANNATIDMILITDPALARWDHLPARGTWMQRLTDPKASMTVRVSAIESLQIVRHSGAADMLQNIATDRQVSAQLRLPAARALADIQMAGSESIARSLMAGWLTDRLVVVSLLRHHSGDEAVQLLKKMAQDPEPAVAAVALKRLLEIDPLLIEPFGDKLLANADPKVRLLVAHGVFVQKSPRALGVLAPLLNDVYPPLRAFVRRKMIEQFAMPELARTIERLAVQQAGGGDWKDRGETAMAVLVKSQWRRLEQAVIMLGAIDYKPAADRLISLLQYPRVEVRVAAAIALRRLAIKETLPDVFDYAKRAANWQIKQSADPHVGLGVARKHELDEQMAHLLQMFALMDYFPPEVERLMRKHVPKTTPAVERFGKEARAAAIWALGHFLAGRPDKALADELARRLDDNSPMDPEEAVVKRMAAITLGRMGVKFPFALGMVKKHMTLSASTVDLGGACRWAYMQITGEYIEPFGPMYRKQGGLSFRILDEDTPEDEYDTEIE